MASRRVSRLLQAAVAAVLVALLLETADLGGIGALLGRVPLRAFALGAALGALALSLQALRWRILMDDPGVPFRECYVFTGLGSALAMVSPSGALSDGAVGYWLGRRRGMVVRSLSALLAARLMGAAAGFLLLFAALPSHARLIAGLRPWVSPRWPLIAALAAALAALAVAALAAARSRRDRLASLRGALPPPRPGILASAGLLSVGVHLCQMGVQWIGYRAVGAPVAFGDVVFFAPLVILLGMIPISIGGMGVREGLGILFYTLLPGVAREQVLAQAAFGYLVLLALAGVNLAAAAALLGLPGRGTPSAPEASARGAGRAR